MSPWVIRVSSIFRVLRRGGHALLNLAYPSLCEACGEERVSLEQRICYTCLKAMEPADSEEVEHLFNRWEWYQAQPELRGFSCWMFDKGGRLQRIHQRLKYGNQPQLGYVLGRWMAYKLREKCPADACCIPIPLSRLRLYERGYNQSAWLARGMCAVGGWKLDIHSLYRTRHTRSQTSLSREQRWENVSQAFAVRSQERVSGKPVVLVDDVLTTGATMMAAAQQLLRAGTSSVTMVTLGFARF